MFNFRLKTLLLSLLALFATLVVDAQEEVSCVTSGGSLQIEIYFPYDNSDLHPDYMSNALNLQRVDSRLRDTSYISTLSRIEITAQSSPEGSMSYNEQLSERRKQTLERYFKGQYPDIDPSMWLFKSVAENWDLFHHNLERAEDLPHRDAVLKISESAIDPDERERQLEELADGEPWSYIKEHILPSQRFGAGVVFVPKLPNTLAGAVAFVAPETHMMQLATPRYIPELREAKVPLFAIKTNLLYDLAAAVNLEIEVPIGDRFSMTAEWINPWWHNAATNYTMRVHMGTVGVKYWLGDRSKREQLTGWAVGANVGEASDYDFQFWKERGIQGTYFMAGATVSYAHKIYKRLGLEYQLGLGYTLSDYKNYTMAYNTEHGDIKVFDYPWVVKRRTFVGPSQIRVSLVYLLTKKRLIKQ